MASLYITEYIQQPIDTAGMRIPAGEEPAIVTQKITIAGSSTPSVAFNVSTKFIRLHTDAICSVKFGEATPVATTDDTRMYANTTEFFGVIPGLMLAVIANT